MSQALEHTVPMNEPAPRLIVALAQVDPTVGDLSNNAALIEDSIARARDAGAGLVVLPELCLPGYPPRTSI